MNAVIQILLSIFFIATAENLKAQDKSGLLKVTLKESHPLASREVMRKRMGNPKEQKYAGVDDTPLKLKHQHVDIYVPQDKHASYGILVWLPSRHDSRPSKPWRAVLNKAGIIWASPQKAVDKQTISWHRSALALSAVHYLKKKYKIDKSRIYIGGFSGGGGRALITALFYPDVFKGCLRVNSLHPFKAFRIGKTWVQGGLTKTPDLKLYNQARKEQAHLIICGGKDRNNSKEFYEALLKHNYEKNGFKRASGIWVEDLGFQLPDEKVFKKALDYLGNKAEKEKVQPED